MAVHRIAVLSDTHNLLRPEVLSVLETCEIILHAGDISTPEIFDRLQNIRKTCAVRGNNDRGWAEDIPLVRQFELYGINICMTHIKRNIPREHNADLVIYGHSHRYSCAKDGGTLFLNPGSCGPRRFNQEITMAVLTVTESDGSGRKMEVERIDIPHEVPSGKDGKDKRRGAEEMKSMLRTTLGLPSGQDPRRSASDRDDQGPGNLPGEKSSGSARDDKDFRSGARDDQSPGNLRGEKSSGSARDDKDFRSARNDQIPGGTHDYKRTVTTDLVRRVCSDVDREKTVDEIAARRRIDPGLADQIVRMYLTHQEVTPEQIMAKLGL